MRTLLIRALTAAIILTAYAPPVAASGPEAAQEPAGDLALDLARLYVAEAGWYRRADHQAIYHSLAEGAHRRGVSLHRQLKDYGAPGAAWVQALGASNERPDAWPAHLDWEPYARLWARVRAAAATDVVFAPPNPCNGTPRHWGGMSLTTDRARANRAVLDGRWVALNCGATGNTYFATR